MIEARKKQILKRLADARANRFNRIFRDPNPVIGSNDVKYELAERAQAINYAGVSAMVKLAKHVGLVDGILVTTTGECKEGMDMVMTSLAWNLKAWTALLIPIEVEHKDVHRLEKKRLLTMEFRSFQAAIIHIPCQIIRHARQTIHRLLSWNDYTPAFCSAGH